jgi:hypothetical protein
MIITERDPETVHDGRPTHRKQPSWLVDARMAMEYAWKQHTAVCDAFESGWATHDDVAAALQSAQDQQAWYFDQYAAWQAGQVPASVQIQVIDLV